MNMFHSKINMLNLLSESRHLSKSAQKKQEKQKAKEEQKKQTQERLVNTIRLI